MDRLTEIEERLNKFEKPLGNLFVEDVRFLLDELKRLQGCDCHQETQRYELVDQEETDDD